jgi:hypothetical protein
MPILYPIGRKWKKVELWKYKQKTKEIIRDKCILLGIKYDNTPPKFVVLVENTTQKYHNSYKSWLKNIDSNNYGTYGNKGDS